MIRNNAGKIVSTTLSILIAPLFVWWLTRDEGPLNPKPTPTPTVISSTPTPTSGPKLLEIRILDVKTSLVSTRFGEFRPVKRQPLFSPTDISGTLTSLTWNLEYSIINDGNESGQGCVLRLSQMVTKPRVYSAPAANQDIPRIEGEEEGNVKQSNQFGIPSIRQVVTMAMQYEAEMAYWSSPFLPGRSGFSPIISGLSADERYSAAVKAVVTCRNGQSASFDQEISASRTSSPTNFATLVASPLPSPSPSPSAPGLRR